MAAFCFILTKFMQKLTQKLKKIPKTLKRELSAYLSRISQKFQQTVKKLQAEPLLVALLHSHRAKVTTLLCLIALFSYVILFKQHYREVFFAQKTHLKEKTPQEMEKENLKKELKLIVKGYPIERMIPYIAEKDRETVAYLIGIAKKESAWGERRPVLLGKDCYNYWGFRAQRERMGSGGHTCFDSPREAVAVVSKRIAEIIKRNDAESARDLLVWKCGSDCSVTGGQDAANKWAEDVDFYAKQVLN
jgi:hypothetical protein